MCEIKRYVCCHGIEIQGFNVAGDIEAKHLFSRGSCADIIKYLEQIWVLFRKFSWEEYVAIYRIQYLEVHSENIQSYFSVQLKARMGRSYLCE